MFAEKCPRHRTGRSTRGFTLVEILLVVTILLILSAISAPYLVKSIRGNRLRAATTAVVQAGRYARSIAILSQREMVLTFDLKNAVIRVAPRYATPAPPSPATGGAPAATGEAPPDDLSADASSNSQVSAVGSSFALSRKLDEVRIDSVDAENKDKNAGHEEVSIIYRSNGRCTPYRVRLVDEKGNAMVTEVDALSSPATRREGR